VLREPLVKLLSRASSAADRRAGGWCDVEDRQLGAGLAMISHARTRLYIASELVFALVLIACLAFAARFG
jgi:hypothetical protein